MKKRGLEPIVEEEKVQEQTISQVLARVLGRARVGRANNPEVATEEELIELNDVDEFRAVLELQVTLVEDDVPTNPSKRFPPWLTELIRRINAIPPTERVDYNLLRQAIT